MKIPVISRNTLAFQKLIEPYKENYTYRQEKFANCVKEVISQTNPADKKGRTYLEFLEKEYNIDLYVEPVDRFNGIRLHGVNRITGETDLISQHRKGFKPQEKDIVGYISELDDKAKDFIEKFVSYSILALCFVGMIIFAKKCAPTEKLEGKAVKELIQKEPLKMENISAYVLKGVNK